MQVILGLVLLHLAYYTYLLIVNNILISGTIRNTPSLEVEKLRSKYKVNIKTYRKNQVHPGFNLFGVIYINEKHTHSKKRLNFVFHHEYYHYIKKHTYKTAALRVVIALSPLLALIYEWWIALIVWYCLGMILHFTQKYFDKKANQYAESR